MNTLKGFGTIHICLISHEVFEVQSCNIKSLYILVHWPIFIIMLIFVLKFWALLKSIENHIMHALKDNPNAIQDLLKYLESSYAYCHIPLSMTILVFLFKELGYDKTELPTT